jgi:CheY-like chemotaxis protein
MPAHHAPSTTPGKWNLASSLNPASHVLVVDDDDDIREAVVEVLRLEGFIVSWAVNGANALEHLRALTDLPDVILLDLIMPVKDGFQFRQEQIGDERLKEIPVVMMTANLAPDKRAEGVNAFLKKPVNVVDMIEALRKATLS